MKSKKKRLFTWIFLGLFVFPFVLMLWRAVQNMIYPPIPHAIISSYSYEAQYDEVQRGDESANIWIGHFCDKEKGINVSLYPYSHFNGLYKLPQFKEDSGALQMRSVEYQFAFIGNNFQMTAINFYANQHWRTLYEDSNKLYEQLIDKHWPFNKRTLICELSSEIGFYDPITISGLEGCGILLLTSEDPGLETDMFVYLPTLKGWTQARFLMPDGTELECIHGFVRRYADLFSSSYVDNNEIGKMELCIKNQDGDYEICQVTGFDGILKLTPNTDTGVTDDILLNWTY